MGSQDSGSLYSIFLHLYFISFSVGLSVAFCKMGRLNLLPAKIPSSSDLHGCLQCFDFFSVVLAVLPDAAGEEECW